MFKKKSNQDELKKQMATQWEKTNGWYKAQAILLNVFADIKIEMIKTAVALYIDWHEKQHGSDETCEHCKPVQNHIIMYSMIEGYYEAANRLFKK